MHTCAVLVAKGMASESLLRDCASTRRGVSQLGCWLARLVQCGACVCVCVCVCVDRGRGRVAKNTAASYTAQPLVHGFHRLLGGEIRHAL
jgi:hypothetical protein